MAIPSTIFQNLPGGNFPASLWDQAWDQTAALTNISCAVSGTANSIVLTPAATSPGVAAYQNGMKFSFVAIATNTGAVQIQVGSLTSYALYSVSGSAISTPATIVNATYYEVVWLVTLNSGVGGFVLLQSGPSGGSGGWGITYTPVTASGNYTVNSSDVILLINQSPAAAMNVIAPASATRNQPIIIKDYAYEAQENNITFVPNGSETVDGFSPATAASNGVAVISTNGGWAGYWPLSSGGWYKLL